MRYTRPMAKEAQKPLPTDEDQARMREILRRRARNQLDDRMGGEVTERPIATPVSGERLVSNAVNAGAASAENTPSTLEWARVDKFAMRTVCKTYTCSKVSVLGKVQYELSKRSKDGWCYYPLHMKLPSFEYAKKLAEEDAALRPPTRC